MNNKDHTKLVRFCATAIFKLIFSDTSILKISILDIHINELEGSELWNKVIFFEMFAEFCIASQS